MFKSALYRAEGVSPCGRLTTTYTDDFRPRSQMNHQSNASPSCSFVDPQQGNIERWPLCFQHLYRTTNATYGSSLGSQPACGVSHPEAFPSYGVPPSPCTREVRSVCPPPIEATTQEGGIPRESRFSCEDFDANRHPEPRAEPHRSSQCQYEEGVIILSPCRPVRPNVCDDFFKSVANGGVSSFNLPDNTTPYLQLVYNKDCANGEVNTHVWHSSPPALDQSRAKPAKQLTRPVGRLPLTEYQDKYSAKWKKPQGQHVCHRMCACHWSL